MNKRRFNRAVDRRISAEIAKIPNFNGKPDAERWMLIGRLTLRAVAHVLKDAPQPICQFLLRPNFRTEGHSDE